MAKCKVYETKEDWLKFRKGMFTASEIHRLLTEPTKKELEAGEVLSKGAKTYVKERIAALLSLPEPEYYSAAMQRGNEAEPQAVLAFANRFGLDVNSDDFIYTSIGGFVFFSDESEIYGGTPDIILPKAVVEIKCPSPHTHIDYLMLSNCEELKELKPEYYSQIQLNLHLCEKELGYFVSFDDRYHDNKHHLKILEVPKDDDFINRMVHKINHAEVLKRKMIADLK